MHTRLCASFLTLLASSALGAAEPMPAARQFLDAHCADCHDADEKKGGLDLTALKADFTNADNFATWVKVLDRTESGEMPPKKKDRPPAAESAAFLGSLTKDLTDAEGRAIKAGGGRTSVRRMNRTEYENALRDLLALPLLRVKELLPEDGQQFGFDKVAGAGPSGCEIAANLRALLARRGMSGEVTLLCSGTGHCRRRLPGCAKRCALFCIRKACGSARTRASNASPARTCGSVTADHSVLVGDADMAFLVAEVDAGIRFELLTCILFLISWEGKISN